LLLDPLWQRRDRNRVVDPGVGSQALDVFDVDRDAARGQQHVTAEAAGVDPVTQLLIYGGYRAAKAEVAASARGSDFQRGGDLPVVGIQCGPGLVTTVFGIDINDRVAMGAGLECPVIVAGDNYVGAVWKDDARYALQPGVVEIANVGSRVLEAVWGAWFF